MKDYRKQTFLKTVAHIEDGQTVAWNEYAIRKVARAYRPWTLIAPSGETSFFRMADLWDFLYTDIVSNGNDSPAGRASKYASRCTA